MAKRWNERSRKALTEFGTGGKMWKGAGGDGHIFGPMPKTEASPNKRIQKGQ